MSKYILEADERSELVQVISVMPNGTVYTTERSIDELNELTSDYINEHFGSLQDDAYQRGFDDAHRISEEEYHRGLDDAWETAKKVVLSPEEGGMSTPTLFEIFRRGSVQHVFKNYSASQVIEKLKAYEEKQKADDKIEVGDEVNAEDGTSVFTVTWMSENCICGVDEGGKCYSYEPQEICGKTGRHVDIQSILEAMKHD